MSASPASHFAALNGIRSHYVTWGTPGTPALVAVHGLRAYGRWFDPLGAALAERFFVVAPDLRGRNLSEWAKDGDYRLEAYVADVVALADHLGLDRFALVGHSLGGTIATSLAARHQGRVAALVLLDSSPEPGAEGMTRIRAEVARTPPAFKGWDEARAFLRTIHRTASEDHIATRLQCMLKEAGDGSLVWRIDFACAKVALNTPEQEWGILQRLRCPVQIVRGDSSDILTAETFREFRRRMPGVDCAEVANAGHMLLEDNPDAVVAAIADFVGRRSRRAEARQAVPKRR